jgi:hypothetical protein
MRNFLTLEHLTARVEFRGFSRDLIKTIRPYVEPLLQEIEKYIGRPLEFPSPILPMTPLDIRKGRAIKDKGHEGGAGHGLYDDSKNQVRINPNMDPLDVLANMVHEYLHWAGVTDEVQADKVTDILMRRSEIDVR